MSRHDEPFSPDTLDDMLAELMNGQVQEPDLSNLSPDATTRANGTNVRLVHDLSSLTKDDSQRLKRIREHLGQVYEAGQTFQSSQGTKQSNEAPGNPAFNVVQSTATQPLSLVSRRKGSGKWAKTDQHARKKNSHSFVQLVSGLVAILVIASMLILFTRTDLHPTAQKPARPFIEPQTVTPPGYYVKQNGDISRVDVKNGEVLWTFPLPSSETFSPSIAVYGNTVYAVATTGLYAIDALKGLQRWFHPLSDLEKVFHITASNGLLYLAFDHGVYTLKTANGQLFHTYKLQVKDIPSSMTIAGNILYMNVKPKIYAINFESGQELWQKPLAADVTHEETLSNMEVHNNIIYGKVFRQEINSYDLYLIAIQAGTGEVLWRSELTTYDPYAYSDSNITYSISNGVVYYSTVYSTILHAYDVQGSKELWQKDLHVLQGKIQVVNDTTLCILAGMATVSPKSTLAESPPLITKSTDNNTGRYTYIGLVALTMLNGEVKWQYPNSVEKMISSTQSFNSQDPQQDIVQEGSIYVTIGSNNPEERYAFTADGSIAWHKSFVQKVDKK